MVAGAGHPDADVNLIDRIAEQRILEALERGELDDLPGAGRPLELDDDTLVPAEMRLACRVLKNAGFVPREVTLRRELLAAAAVERGEDDAARAAAGRRLTLLRAQLDASRGGRSPLWIEEAYRQAAAARLNRRRAGAAADG